MVIKLPLTRAIFPHSMPNWRELGERTELSNESEDFGTEEEEVRAGEDLVHEVVVCRGLTASVLQQRLLQFGCEHLVVVFLPLTWMALLTY